MSKLVAVAGSKIYIGRRVSLKTKVTAADFVGATWTEIKGLATLGALGNTQNFVTQSFIDEAFDIQVKGTVTGGTMENVFSYDANDPGQIALREAIQECLNYEFKVEAGVGCIPTSTAVISNGANATVTVAGGHGFDIGSPVVFATDGTLPTGITAGDTYYVIATGFTSTVFQFSATPGGTAVTTSSAGTGEHTVTGQPAGATALFIGLPGEGTMQGGDANTAQLQTYPIAVNSNIVRV